MTFNVNPDREFTVAILPDTQYYSRDNPAIFEAQTQWIVDNQDEYNIQMVLHEGDLVHNYSSATAEWDAAEAAMNILDDNTVPALLVPGNHDSDETDQRSIPEFRSRFPSSRYDNLVSVNDTIVDYGTYEGHPENIYLLQNILGGRFLYLGLEFGPRQEVVDWAGQILTEYSDRNAIIDIHSFTGPNGELATDGESAISRPPSYYFNGDDNHNGSQLWDALVRNHGNVVHITNGHYVDQDGNTYAATGNDWSGERNWVTHSYVNYQDHTNGGNGFLRLLTLDIVMETARVHTYSPHVDSWRTNSAEEFEFDYERLSTGNHSNSDRLRTGLKAAGGGSLTVSSGRIDTEPETDG